MARNLIVIAHRGGVVDEYHSENSLMALEEATRMSKSMPGQLGTDTSFASMTRACCAKRESKDWFPITLWMRS